MSNDIDSQGRQHIETEEVRGATSNTGLRYVLMVSLTLVVILFALIYFLT